MPHVAFHTFPVPEFSSPAFSSLAFSASPPAQPRTHARATSDATARFDRRSRHVVATAIKIERVADALADNTSPTTVSRPVYGYCSCADRVPLHSAQRHCQSSLAVAAVSRGRRKEKAEDVSERSLQRGALPPLTRCRRRRPSLSPCYRHQRPDVACVPRNIDFLVA